MISVEEALSIVLEQKLELDTEQVKLENAAGRILAEDVFSNIPHPYFNVTAVDGYAFKHEEGIRELKQVGEIAAGDLYKSKTNKGECLRIFTGAAVPKDCDTVIMQEYTRAQGEQILITKLPEKAANVRKSGGQLKKGDRILQKGDRVNAAAIGLLKSLGITALIVFRKIKIKCLVTGNEFASSRSDLDQGKIFETNGLSLLTALGGWTEFSYETCPDDLKTMTAKVKDAAAASDLLIITGGVSVGDYDFSRDALEDSGYKVLFHKVRQKPGKPLLFARKGKHCAFGLPGNPRSVLVALEVYIKAYLRSIHHMPQRKWIRLPLAEAFIRKGDRAQFMSAQIENHRLKLHERQASHMLQSLAKADVLAYFPEDIERFKAGENIECLVLQDGY